LAAGGRIRKQAAHHGLERSRLFASLDRVLEQQAIIAVYRPFSYGGSSTPDSNSEFDEWLPARSAVSGIRDFEAVDALARERPAARGRSCDAGKQSHGGVGTRFPTIDGWVIAARSDSSTREWSIGFGAVDRQLKLKLSLNPWSD